MESNPMGEETAPHEGYGSIRRTTQHYSLAIIYKTETIGCWNKEIPGTLQHSVEGLHGTKYLPVKSSFFPVRVDLINI